MSNQPEKSPPGTYIMRVTGEERAMIKQYRAAKVCASKQPFDTDTAAKRQAIQRMMRSRDKAPALRVYSCPICGKFHLTKQKHPRDER
jgi:hypothetical protein